MVGGWWISNDAHSYWIRKGAGAWSEVPIGAPTGKYAYPSLGFGAGDTDDLLYILTESIMGAINVLYPGSDADFLGGPATATDGIIRLGWYDDSGANESLQIRFDHPSSPNTNKNSYFLHDLLRMTAARTAIITVPHNGEVFGSRSHGYGLYPLRYMMHDLSEWEARVSQAVPDQGTVQTLRTAMLERYRLGIRTDKAYPRAAAWNDFHALVDFMDHASSGRPFRVYPDKTVMTPYEDVTNPFGWRAWVMDKDSASWRPTPAVDNWYRVLDVELMAWQYIA